MPVRELPFDRSTISASAMERSIDVPNASHVVTTNSCRVEQLNERGEKAWEGYVSEHPEGTIFHTLAWRNAVAGAFGHEALYLVAMRGDRLVGVLPIFFVASKIGGCMLVSVPYAVGGGILADDEEAIAALARRTLRLGGDRNCNRIDFRSDRAIVRDWPVVDRYVGFRRALPASVDEVLTWLPRKARAAARNARRKFGLTVSFDDEHLAEVWRLYSISMRRLGSLTYPYGFFRRLIEQTPGRHWVSLIRREGRAVAGLVTFLHRDRVMPYFMGATDEAKRCSAANFVYLTAMERGVEEGFGTFDFGRSRIDNAGSYNFKRFNGFTPQPLGYQCYTPPGERPVDLTPTNPLFAVGRRIWPMLPLWVTRAVGARLSKHIPG